MNKEKKYNLVYEPTDSITIITGRVFPTLSFTIY